MKQLAIEFKKIYEHDMDLLIIEEFISDRQFARIFLDKLQLPDDYTVQEVAHSLSDADGESDITLILQYPDKRIALLIEDKIDAPTMPGQSERYQKRGNTGVSRREYDKFYVILVAPADYHREHLNDSNAAYTYRVYYEELREYLGKQKNARAVFKTAVIDTALREKKVGYQVQEVKAVTEFWMKLRQFCKENYPKLTMMGENTPKGASAAWPEFRTSLGSVKVIYKSQKGHVDLEFPQYGDKIADLKSIVKNRMSTSMRIERTGKSASVRIADERWKLDFSKDFNQYRDVVTEVLQAVLTLCEFASTINYSELY